MTRAELTLAMGDVRRSPRLHTPVQYVVRFMSRLRRGTCRRLHPEAQGIPHLDVCSEGAHLKPMRRELALLFGPFKHEPGNTTHVYALNLVGNCKPLFDSASHSVSTRLPLEVQECIVGFLGSGSMSALGAALICRSWYPSAITLFYETIEIPNRCSSDKLVWSALNNTRVRGQLARTQSVIFRDQACIPTFPLVLGAVLPSLSSLVIFKLQDPLHPTFFTALYQLSSITHLRLTAAWIHNFFQIQRLISALRCLKHLDIGNVHSQQLTDDTQSVPFHPAVLRPVSIRLETLILSVSSSIPPTYLAALIDWLVRTSVCESLTSLTLYGPPRLRKKLAEKTSSLFQAAGPSLLMLKNPYCAYVY